MLGGYLEFFMEPATAEMYQRLRRELEELIQNKVTILCLFRIMRFCLLKLSYSFKVFVLVSSMDPAFCFYLEIPTLKFKAGRDS